MTSASSSRTVRRTLRTVVEPSLENWTPSAPPADRPGLAALTKRGAVACGTPMLDESGPIIATGHQATLWHPGIFAKFVAAHRLARRLGGTALHLIVDHDTQTELSIDLPIVRDGLLSVHKVELAPIDPLRPTGSQPAVEPAALARAVREARDQLGDDLAVNVEPLLEALAKSGSFQSLAEQIAAVLTRLMRPYVDPMPTMFSSDLMSLPCAESLLEQLRTDASRCARLYNEATAAHPAAGVGRLAATDTRIEMPLWRLPQAKPRLRVYVDQAADDPRFVDETGRVIEPGERLAPRAVLLSAMMRRCVCDLFIHGTGGRHYDRVTEQWYRTWAKQALGPMATVTADVFLPLDVPVYDQRQLHHAVWRRHHLRHNIDREAELRGEDVRLARRKRELLEHMDDDRDRERRAAAFAELHRINDELARRHEHLIRRADARLDRVKKGVVNAELAARRDWCFALYPARKLFAMAEQLMPQHTPACHPCGG